MNINMKMISIYNLWRDSLLNNTGKNFLHFDLFIRCAYIQHKGIIVSVQHHNIKVVIKMIKVHD